MLPFPFLFRFVDLLNFPVSVFLLFVFRFFLSCFPISFACCSFSLILLFVLSYPLLFILPSPALAFLRSNTLPYFFLVLYSVYCYLFFFSSSSSLLPGFLLFLLSLLVAYFTIFRCLFFTIFFPAVTFSRCCFLLHFLLPFLLYFFSLFVFLTVFFLSRLLFSLVLCLLLFFSHYFFLFPVSTCFLSSCCFFSPFCPSLVSTYWNLCRLLVLLSSLIPISFILSFSCLLLFFLISLFCPLSLFLYVSFPLSIHLCCCLFCCCVSSFLRSFFRPHFVLSFVKPYFHHIIFFPVAFLLLSTSLCPLYFLHLSYSAVIPIIVLFSILFLALIFLPSRYTFYSFLLSYFRLIAYSCSPFFSFCLFLSDVFFLSFSLVTTSYFFIALCSPFSSVSLTSIFIPHSLTYLFLLPYSFHSLFSFWSILFTPLFYFLFLCPCCFPSTFFFPSILPSACCSLLF